MRQSGGYIYKKGVRTFALALRRDAVKPAQQRHFGGTPLCSSVSSVVKVLLFSAPLRLRGENYFNCGIASSSFSSTFLNPRCFCSCGSSNKTNLPLIYADERGSK
jgi:hypothetical protein